jgi:2-polyprenyl-6-methoxyphenol hydroxylase-like FAD-dependent oxidoreductase
MTMDRISRYEPDQSTQVGNHAVVLGGSMAGLCTARVLADVFSEVTVLERDQLPDAPAARPGAPQTHHPHVLLEAGRQTLVDLFPSFDERVISRGGLLVDGASEMDHYEQGDFFASGPERLPMLCASRALFEFVTQQRVRSLDTVEIREKHSFVDYLYEESTGTVTGVEVRDETETGTHTVSADLVVDATGRTSRTPRWLVSQGYPRPTMDEVTVDVTYSTIRVDRPPEDRTVLLIPPSTPRTRGAAAIPIENDQWELILQGMHGDAPPETRAEFVDIANGMPVARISELATEHEWRSEQIQQYPFPSSIRRHYEELDTFPDGLLVVGDAIASFNPVYGQGMSVGALEALCLHHALVENGRTNVADRFFDAAADVVDTAWQIAVGADFAFSKTAGSKPLGTDLINRYLDRLVRKAHSDGELTDAYYRVFRLERPTTSLLHPGVVWRVLRPS